MARFWSKSSPVSFSHFFTLCQKNTTILLVADHQKIFLSNLWQLLLKQGLSQTFPTKKIFYSHPFSKNIFQWKKFFQPDSQTIFHSRFGAQKEKYLVLFFDQKQAKVIFDDFAFLSNAFFLSLDQVEKNSASVFLTNQLWDWWQTWKLTFSLELANLFWLALYLETKQLTTSHLDSPSFTLLAHLVEQGIDVPALKNNLLVKTKTELNLEGKILTSFQQEGKLVYLLLTPQDFQAFPHLTSSLQLLPFFQLFLNLAKVEGKVFFLQMKEYLPTVVLLAKPFPFEMKTLIKKYFLQERANHFYGEVANSKILTALLLDLKNLVNKKSKFSQIKSIISLIKRRMNFW